MSTYHEELKNKETLRLREIQKELPAFTQSFFRGIAQTTSTKTRLAYAYDLRIFFRYLYEEHRTLGGVETKEMLAELSQKYDNLQEKVFGAIKRSNLKGWNDGVSEE